MFKGKVSQAMAQRKHLKPARLDVSGQDKTMHRLRNFDEDVASGWAAAADDPAVHTGGPNHREHAAGCKAETLKDEHPKFQDNRHVRCSLHPELAPAWPKERNVLQLLSVTTYFGVVSACPGRCSVKCSSQGETCSNGA